VAFAKGSEGKYVAKTITNHSGLLFRF